MGGRPVSRRRRAIGDVPVRCSPGAVPNARPRDRSGQVGVGGCTACSCQSPALRGREPARSAWDPDLPRRGLPRRSRATSERSQFFKRLRPALGGGPFPYLWVPEWHKIDHSLHAHFAVGQFVSHSVIECAWGHGFVHIKRLGRGERVGTLSSSRRSAGYLSKYVSKSFDRRRTRGLHRYDRAQGFAPRVERVEGTSRGEVIALASERMGRRPTRVWVSDEADNWKGPPAIWAGWHG